MAAGLSGRVPNRRFIAVQLLVWGCSMTYDFYYWLGFSLGVLFLVTCATGIVWGMFYAATRRNLLKEIGAWWRDSHSRP